MKGTKPQLVVDNTAMAVVPPPPTTSTTMPKPVATHVPC